MRSVLFVGDSHLAALRQGAQAVDGALDYKPVFFGAPSDALEGLVARGNALASGSRRLSQALKQLWNADSISLEGIDCIAIVGLGVGAGTLAALGTQFRIDAFHAGSERRLLTRATFQVALDGLLRASLMFRVMQTVASATRAPIVLIPEPAPCELVTQRAAGRWILDAQRTDEARFLAGSLHDAIARVFSPHVVVAQAPATLASPLTTQEEFMKGSTRLKLRGDDLEEHGERDVKHANARFGAMVLQAVGRHLPTEAAAAADGPVSLPA